MNPHLAKAIETYGNDFQKLLTWHLCHGVVVCGPDYFAFGYHSHHLDPCEAVLYPHCDTLFVTFCSGDMPGAIESHADRYDFIAYQRAFTKSPRAMTVRVMPMGSFLSKLTT